MKYSEFKYRFGCAIYNVIKHCIKNTSPKGNSHYLSLKSTEFLSVGSPLSNHEIGFKKTNWDAVLGIGTLSNYTGKNSITNKTK